MADFNIDRIRFRWKNIWQVSTQYVKDDIVVYGAKTYVCLTGHESAADNIYTDLAAVVNNKPAPRWELMFDGTEWKADWTNDTYYKIGDIVKWKGYIYKCIEGHQSTAQIVQGPIADITKWTIVATTYNWRNTWTPTVAPDPNVPGDIGVTSNYDLGDVVIYNGLTYICTEKHTAADSYALGLEDDQDKWQFVTRSDNWRTDWQTNTRYVIDDVVKYGGIVYRCTQGHTSAVTVSAGLEDSDDKWEIVVEGIEFKGDWLPETRYKKNDIVKSGGTLFKANQHHTSQNSLRADDAVWDVWVLGVEYEGVWDSGIEYNIGDVVKYGGYSYTALTNNVGSVPSVNGLLQDQGDWELATQGYRFIGEWASDVNYLTGDVVRNSGYLWEAITDNSGTFPDSDDTIWRVLVTGRQFRNTWIDDTVYYLGDIVTYAGTLYICIQRHTGTESDTRPDLDIENTNENYWRVLLQGKDTNVLTTIGDIRTHDGSETLRLAIGTPGNALKVSNSSALTWDAFEEVPNTFYVSVDGTDGAGNGRTISAPFRTVKYALDYIYNNLGEVKYNPTRYTNASGGFVTVISTAILNDFLGTLAAEAPTLSAALNATNPRTGTAYGDLDSNVGIDTADAIPAIERQLFVAGATTEETIRYLELVNYLNSIADTLSAETVTYAQVGNDDIVMPVTIDTYPNTTVFVKTGIYDEITPMKLPRNCALVGDELRGTVIQPAPGYEEENMFFVNNGSGIRNMTLQGLSGTLGDPNQYFTRRPTAGAFVSLDPGSGPDDQSVWIINKSCYVQNVTTFGTACIGLKVDGSLHNGGNRSVVANDFTQVLSDGIGYWAKDGGRSELVSVFTYFCHIGYLAEDGGVVRATNGNNSYGLYGSVAEGVDATEIPISAQIDNQTKEAPVSRVITNGNEIIALEYDNLGGHYFNSGTGAPDAQIQFTGTGAGAAAIYDEVRSKGVSNIRILGEADSSIPGGLNYQYLLNNAQGGNEFSITLAAADETGTPEKYIGMRIVIVSGAGVGQYGYITGYNAATKVAIISKEYNGTAGWQNLDPGRPIVSTLDTTTRYSLEPRVEIEAPPVSIQPNITKNYPEGFTAGAGNDYIGSIEWIENYGASAPFDNGTWIAINTNGDAAFSNDGQTFTITALDLTGTGDSVGSGLLSTSDNDYAYFLHSGSSTVYRYQAQTNTWANWTLDNHNNQWSAITTDKNGTIVAVWEQGATKCNQDGSSQSYTTFTNVGGTPWTSVTYGSKGFVAIKADSVTAISLDGITWSETNNISILNQPNWLDIAYGNGRYVAVGADNTNAPTSYEAQAAYSFDGVTWYTSDNHIATLPTYYTSRVIYRNGEFLAFSESTSGSHVVKSQDGWAWQWFAEDSTQYSIGTTQSYAFGVSNTEIWVAPAFDYTSVIEIESGAQAIARAIVESSRVTSVKMYDPGGGYDSAPDIIFYDPDNTAEALYEAYVRDGVLAQPVFTNRGNAYVSATGTVSGPGYADIFQTGRTLFLKNVSAIPGPGANVVINGIDDVTYRLTKVISTTGTGPYNIEINISPTIGDLESPAHEESVILREKYSQIRLTGHDFLDIGTGNTNTTRYPDLYLEGVDSLNEPQPFNETVDNGGGRVFYTSTDQDGNFRVGELFEVEQATGSVTVNADLFELNGLSELSLGGVVVGGSQVVIREFSKDGTFVANSNNIVPTQAAIIKYLESRISSGGSDALTNTLIAGQVKVSASYITTTSDNQINIPVLVNQTGGGIDGDYLALQLFGI